MARSGREGSMSGGEESESESESDSEEQVRFPIYEAKGNKMSEYEKQRLLRIAENKARLEALGISKAANALLTPSPGSRKRRGKSNSGGEEDDDYRPSEGGDGDDEDEIDDSECDEEDEEFLGNSSSVSRKRKAALKKKATSASKRKLVLSRKNSNRPDPLGEDDGDDDDLNKAIALSLQDSLAVAEGSHSTTPSKRRRNDQEAASWKKKKPELMMSKMQMTQDELVIYFYHFDEAGKGFITLRDVVKMATLHDFTWTDEELQQMIRCFDMDKDGKLNLDDFRKIVTRCRILKES